MPVPFQPLPVVLGLMGHMMNSVILAFLFAQFVAPRLRSTSALLFGGMICGLIGSAPWLNEQQLKTYTTQ